MVLASIVRTGPLRNNEPMSLSDALREKPVIPLIQADDPESGIAIAQALAAGGMPVVEVVQRTDASLQALEAIVRSESGLIVGAGTVLNDGQARACIDAGAEFIVSPGLDDGVIEAARSRSVPVIPGIMTPTELQRAVNLDLETVKFFPASSAGGVNALKALASVFRHMRFVPTGGVTAANLAQYLALDAVLACGGSWMAPKDAVEAKDFERIRLLAAGALETAKSVRTN